jgi:hypothetical protein
MCHSIQCAAFFHFFLAVQGVCLPAEEWGVHPVFSKATEKARTNNSRD